MYFHHAMERHTQTQLAVFLAWGSIKVLTCPVITAKTTPVTTDFLNLPLLSNMLKGHCFYA
jgi:hypothetical protein